MSMEPTMGVSKMRYLLSAFIMLSVLFPAHADELSYNETQIQCLARSIYEEGRSEQVWVQRRIGEILLAGADDKKEEWGRWSVCRVAYQKGYLSWNADDRLFVPPKEKVAHTLALMIARDLYSNREGLPKGWECVRNFERTDFKGASDRGKRYFKTKLVPVGEFGSFTGYKGKSACKVKLRSA